MAGHMIYDPHGNLVDNSWPSCGLSTQPGFFVPNRDNDVHFWPHWKAQILIMPAFVFIGGSRVVIMQNCEITCDAKKMGFMTAVSIQLVSFWCLKGRWPDCELTDEIKCVNGHMVLYNALI